jgi:polyvinyl alcohol dehydrogenase (cytochrome)
MPCRSGAFNLTGPAWNGWGVDLTNSRFQSAAGAGISAADVPRLKLKWSFAFSGTAIAKGQPTVVGGRLFVPGANRKVYSFDAKSGCTYWSFEPDAPVRASLSLAALNLPGGKSVQAVFFGDRRANAYALDAATGALIWRVKVDDQRNAGITAAPSY